jgi:hypothetical protein
MPTKASPKAPRGQKTIPAILSLPTPRGRPGERPTSLEKIRRRVIPSSKPPFARDENDAEERPSRNASNRIYNMLRFLRKLTPCKPALQLRKIRASTRCYTQVVTKLAISIQNQVSKRFLSRWTELKSRERTLSKILQANSSTSKR